MTKRCTLQKDSILRLVSCREGSDLDILGCRDNFFIWKGLSHGDNHVVGIIETNCVFKERDVF